MGPTCQASVGTRLWDMAAGPARQVGYGIRPPDLPWDPPTRSDLADGTRSSGQCWDPPMGPTRGTHCQSRLVGPNYQVSWWDLGIRLKFTNLNSHVDEFLRCQSSHSILSKKYDNNSIMTI
jgi:hypothetical protein